MTPDIGQQELGLKMARGDIPILGDGTSAYYGWAIALFERPDPLDRDGAFDKTRPKRRIVLTEIGLGGVRGYAMDRDAGTVQNSNSTLQNGGHLELAETQAWGEICDGAQAWLSGQGQGVDISSRLPPCDHAQRYVAHKLWAVAVMLSGVAAIVAWVMAVFCGGAPSHAQNDDDDEDADKRSFFAECCPPRFLRLTGYAAVLLSVCTGAASLAIWLPMVDTMQSEVGDCERMLFLGAQVAFPDKCTQWEAVLDRNASVVAPWYSDNACAAMTPSSTERAPPYASSASRFSVLRASVAGPPTSTARPSPWRPARPATRAPTAACRRALRCSGAGKRR